MNQLHEVSILNIFYVFIILIIFLSGTFGGIVSYFLHDDGNFEKYKLLKDIIIGIGASILVPLFLNMISSNLITTVTLYSNLFVFAGICLLFSISAKSIIENMTNQLLKQLENKQINTEKVLDKLIESHIEPDDDNVRNNIQNPVLQNDIENINVLHIIGKSINPFISQKSIEHDSKLSNVESILKSLTNQEIVSFIIWNDIKYFYLTTKGKSILINS
jgi:hypothetical protein